MSEVLKELERVHGLLALRDNASSVTVKSCAMLGKDFPSAVSGALMTLGGAHAPLEQTAQLLTETDPYVMIENILGMGRKVPGYGSSFYKQEKDPVFDKLDDMLVKRNVYLWHTVHRLSSYMKTQWNVNLFPNAANYTICSLMLEDIPLVHASKYFIQFRLNAWHNLWLDNFKAGPM